MATKSTKKTTRRKTAKKAVKKSASKRKASPRKKSAKSAAKPANKSKRGRAPRDPDAQLEASRYENPIASRKLILETVKQAGALSFDELVSQLGMDSAEQQEALGYRLKAMLRDGQLVQNRKGGYLPVDESHLTLGRVIAHPDGFGFLVPDEGGDDFFLHGKQMRTVLHGDKAVVRLTGLDRRGRKEGAIVSVVERANTTLVGRLFIESGVAFVGADNKRITQDILIPGDALGEAKHGQIVQIEITQQPTFKRQAIGRVIGVIGDHMAPGMEIEVAIHSHGLPHVFSADALRESDALGGEVSAADKTGRLDLRGVPLVTIDGEDARDFDDAVYCEPEGEGWRLLVAIADVAHYVRPGTALDADAYERATSVYFPGRVIPMLPESLSNGLCSLNPDVDRLTMVCDMRVTAQGKVTDFNFHDALIRSHARLTYDQVAAAVVERDKKARQQVKNVLPQLENLYDLYQAMKIARKKRGTINFETVETKIEFDAEQKIKGIHPVKRNDAHKIIEECMIAANVCAARFLAKHKVPDLYRVHEPPEDDKLEELRGFLEDLGLKLGAPAKKITPRDYARLGEKIAKREDAYLIQTLMLRSMKQAVYKPENTGHFGLALSHYAHFTSPIRRYPDLLVHRGIKHVLQQRKRKDYPYSQNDMVSMGEHCSNNERRADEATRDAEAALKCEYMLDKIGNTYKGHVTGVTSFGLFVQLDELFIEGLVHITNLPRDYYEYDPVNHRLSGENRGLTFRLCDAVTVQLNKVDMDERKIDFDLVSPA